MIPPSSFKYLLMEMALPKIPIKVPATRNPVSMIHQILEKLTRPNMALKRNISVTF